MHIISARSSSEKPEFCFPTRLGSRAVCVAGQDMVVSTTIFALEGTGRPWCEPCCVACVASSSEAIGNLIDDSVLQLGGWKQPMCSKAADRRIQTSRQRAGERRRRAVSKYARHVARWRQKKGFTCIARRHAQRPPDRVGGRLDSDHEMFWSTRQYARQAKCLAGVRWLPWSNTARRRRTLRYSLAHSRPSLRISK